jgi:hypothetical protein
LVEIGRKSLDKVMYRSYNKNVPSEVRKTLLVSQEENKKMVKASEINITDVTAEQIGRCHKVYQGSEPVWMVESESDALTEYKVRYSVEHGFTCTCRAGQVGFSNCKEGICKHVKWALAASAEERAAVAELHRAIAEQAAKPVLNIDGKPASEVEVERVMSAPAKPASRRAKAPEPKPFSLLK